ncbi:MAG: NAD(P)/FAD-dependent oxidoreductase [Polyangiales bacterium]
MSRSPAPVVTLLTTRECSRDSREALLLREFLQRSEVAHRVVDITDDRDREEYGELDQATLPLCVFFDGSRLERPSVREVTEKLGWLKKPKRPHYDLAIYGAGPAGLSAAMHAASAGLTTVVVERGAAGGQAQASSNIDDVPGFPWGIGGGELTQRTRQQASRFGAEILLAREGTRAALSARRNVCQLDDGTEVVARASIFATGVEYRRLGVHGETRFIGAGLHYGAGPSDAAHCEGAHVFVVGGGTAASLAAMRLARTARRVSMVMRGTPRTTIPLWLWERVRAASNIEMLTHTELTALQGEEMLESITLEDRMNGRSRTVETQFVYVCIGGTPNTQWVKDSSLALDSAGYVLTGSDLEPEHRHAWPLERDPLPLESSIPGVFVAGDVRHGSVKRCASAVSEGAMAAALVLQHLSHLSEETF